MSRSDDEWFVAAANYCWYMPPAPWWKKLPVIRHIRAVYLAVQLSRHNAFYRALGAIPSGYDEWVLYGIWRGWEASE